MTSLTDHGLVPLAEMREELAGAAVGFPLRDRKGTVRAFAVVDAEDFEAVVRHRWYLRPNGYVARNRTSGRKKQQTILLHRDLLGLAVGDPQKVDHEDHDPLNCARSNIRLCTHAQNHQNRRACGNRDTSSRFRGVSLLRTGRWLAYAKLDGHHYHLGVFDREEAAARVAAAFRAKHMPYTTN